MSLFGSLQTNYLPSPVQTGRMPTVPDGTSDEGVGNGGNAFMSLLEATASSETTSDGKLSMYSALSPELAYRASLIGSMLGDVTAGLPAVDDTDPDDPANDLVGDVTSGVADSYDATDSADETNELQSTDQANTLPRADDEDLESPIGDEGDATFTNALPRSDAPPA